MEPDLYQFKIYSPIGNLYLVASETGLQGMHFDKQSDPLIKTLGKSPAEKILRQAAEEVAEYFAGKRKKFEIPLDIATGTVFQRKVWKALQKIPYGTTCSYKALAASIGSKAVRAVGSANGKNPFCIIIPCHRVIAADGSIGGYYGGLRKKKQLLSLEGVAI
jgi:methylated-DNA-[protein]-cysteine S-methyltransferase